MFSLSKNKAGKYKNTKQGPHKKTPENYIEKAHNIFNKMAAQNILEVPKKIHHFWHGDVSKLINHAENINKISAMNPSYKIRLHILTSNNDDIKSISDLLTNVKVKDVTTEKWFADFKKTDRYKQFEASRNGSRSHYASGADIFKTELLQRKGGIWNDVDNNPLAPIPEKIYVKNGEILTAGPVKFARWGNVIGVHSSTLATHKANNILQDINKASFKKFLALKGIIYEKNQKTDDPDDHFKMISETAGSLHLSNELFEKDPELKKEVTELNNERRKYNDSKIIFDKYFEPTVTTGAGNMDEDQLIALLQKMSGENHVII